MAQPQRLPTAGPVIVCIYKFTDRARDVWEDAPEDLPLWQVQIDHPVQRAITFSYRDSFNDMLRDEASKGKEVPATIAELERLCSVRLVITDAKDPDGRGTFVPWRVAWYVAGDLQNFMLLLDSWFAFKERQLAREQPFDASRFY